MRPDRAAEPVGHERPRVALVTGAGRGLGLEICRQLADLGMDVVLCARREADACSAAAALDGVRGRLFPSRLDVRSEEGVRHAVAQALEATGRIDVLINNAAVLYDVWQTALTADMDTVRDALETNLLGAWRVARAVAPHMREQGYGRIVNVSSILGSMESVWAASPAYSVSKAGLNMLTRLLSIELGPFGVLTNAVCPGWTQTQMGGPGGRAVGLSAAGVCWAATLPDGGPNGGYFHDGRVLPW